MKMAADGTGKNGAGGACLCDGRTRRTTAKDRYAVSAHFACGEINGRAFGGDLRWLSRPSCPPNKKTSRMAGLFVWLKRDKRCPNIGNCEQKVSNLTYTKGNKIHLFTMLFAFSFATNSSLISQVSPACIKYQLFSY